MTEESTPTPALAAPAPGDLRDALTEMVVADLMGPAGGSEEELDQREDHVYKRYLVGMLAPRGDQVTQEELDELATSDGDDGEEGPAESAAPAGASFFPSAMGLSFVVDTAETALSVEAEWGRYVKEESATQVTREGNPAKTFHRHPVVPPPLRLTLQDGAVAPQPPHPDHPEVLLQGKIRRTPGGWVVTLFLVNQQEDPATGKRRRAGRSDDRWLFQPQLRVRGASGGAVFTRRRNARTDLTRMDAITREETETLEMLYRRHREFATGHGVAAHATLPAPLAERAVAVETEWVPRFEVPQQTPRTAADDPNLTEVVLDMRALAEMPAAELAANLRRVHLAYGKWVEREGAKRSDPEEGLAEHRHAADLALERCARAMARLLEGVELLESDPAALEAFRFANRAMALQRVRTMLSREVRKGERAPHEGAEALDIPENRSWRLFQLAFILINLPALTRLDHPDRSHETKAVADLLWFPTGGGKTEAYLGLTAYTLALRRLQGEVGGRRGDHGVAVIMRYTLRLLTLQQFQRAAALLCACEVIRRDDPANWGDVPFRLGLWVGGKATPNTLANAAEVLRQDNLGGRPSFSGTPHQLTACPWCGSEIRGHHLRVYEAPGDIGRCVTYCGDPLGLCPFSEREAPREGLPVMVVDEEIYRRPPSLLIATVDKFAQMPWKGETQMLFGKVSGLCPRHGFLSPEIRDAKRHHARGNLPPVASAPHGPLRPPDLIIQDELHLISGPLGSMVALYEAAVDELCSWTVNGARVRPKVVASTATIRRAPDQVKKLFVRQLEVFPPQGTDIRDNFFSLQRPPGPKWPGRRYLGLCAFGRRYPAAIIRAYVAHMAAAQLLYDRHGRVADPWMTLTGYFNSIRELAGTRRLVEDDIRARLRDADQRGLAKRRVRMGAVEELTSRKPGGDIPKILDRLDMVFDPAAEAARRADREEGKRPAPAPYDAILATNMISVGVDIDRLGLMVVAGQPKNTSEYIQATSRVGRSAHGPGLVCTVFNWARPRDLSHFERFEHYHETFYKHVEPLSVTPFSARALDRGLSGVLVSLIRLWDERLNANPMAGEIRDDDPLWGTVSKLLADRGGNALDDTQVRKRLEDMFNRRRDEWLHRVRQQEVHRLTYNTEAGAFVPLLEKPTGGRWELFTCLNSLRDVEENVKLVLDQNPGGLRPE